MMRVLVLSDSHGDVISLKMAIAKNSDADAVVYLGDGASDFEQVIDSIKHKQIVAVRGNCDSYFCSYPEKAFLNCGEKLIYCTHGYVERVKYGLEDLKDSARKNNANIALYGHTHIAYTAYENGLHIMNPGSVRNNSCGIIDITDGGILCFTKKIIS